MSDIIKDAEKKMGSAVDHAREEFAAIRTGRANPAMFNKLMVEYYGTPTPLQQLASFQVPEARTVLIAPFDKSWRRRNRRRRRCRVRQGPRDR